MSVQASKAARGGFSAWDCATVQLGGARRQRAGFTRNVWGVAGLAGATAFSIATWLRLDTLATWSRVFDLGSGTGANVFLTPRSSAGTARFAITTGGAGAEQRINAPTALPTGAWTHLAVTQTGNLGVLYVNGAEVARNSGLTVRPADLGNTGQNWIGRSQYSGDPYLDGAVDGLRLYGRALTAADVADLHATGQ